MANDFVDPSTGKEFVYTEPSKSWPSEWWGGEPVRSFHLSDYTAMLTRSLTPQIWSTAVKNGLKSAVLMWPGPPVMSDGTKPTQWSSSSLDLLGYPYLMLRLQVRLPEQVPLLAQGRQDRVLAGSVPLSAHPAHC